MEENLKKAIEGATVVMMCGVSGSGKTTMARRMEADGWRRLSADIDVWNRFGGDYASMPADRQRQIYMEAVNSMLEQIPEYVKSGERVVIDSSMCKRAKRNAVRHMCDSLGVKCALIYTSASREELLRRLSSRHGQGPDDQIVPEAELDRFLCNFEAPEPDEHFIHIANSSAVTKA